ncbi:MAG: M36 family metallopeptidase [Kofleriaceae bacterium]
MPWSKVGARILLAATTTAAACTSPGTPPPPREPPRIAAGDAAVAHTRARLAALGVVAQSVRADGRLRFARVAQGAMPAPAGARPEVAARAHLAHLASALEVPTAALSTLRTVRTADRGAAGALVVLRHVLDGVEVYRQDVRVLVRGDGSLAALAGAPDRAATPSSGRATPPRRDAVEVVAAALRDRVGVAVTPVAVASAPRRRVGGGARGPGAPRRAGAGAPGVGRARRRLVRAWRAEFFLAPRGQAPRRRGLALPGRRRRRRHPRARGSPPPTPPSRIAATSNPTAAARQAARRRHPAPGRHPGAAGHALRRAVAGGRRRPRRARRRPDPWLAAGATETRGNNADVYADLVSPDGFGAGDVRGQISAPGVFDHTYDPLAPPVAPAQTQASATDLFYVINWLHDWYYDAGFDEAAGNAQLDNYGRGGLAGDPMRGETQDAYDAGARNNANMTTPSDGTPPRMQVYVWSGSLEASLTLSPGGDTPAVGTAQFGPTDFDVTGGVVVADDGTDTTSDGCEPLVGDVTGKIVLVDRGQCTFKRKTVNAEAAGAIGLVVANNVVGGGTVGMAEGEPEGPTALPLLSIGTADGAALHARLADGPLTARLTRVTGTERDGALDQTIVAHEFGHYLHHRLADCAEKQCRAISEGLGDFLALHLMLREGDDLGGAFPVAQYATASYPDPEYFGIRRAPYSVDPSVNALTLRHIGAGAALPAIPLSPRTGTDNTAVHPAGEIWAAMLHEGYVALLATTTAPGATRTFDEVRRAMSAYLVTGLGMLPPDATYTETRDALLAAAEAANPDDAATLAAAFARRGAGSCAVAPPATSLDFGGIVESFAATSRPEVVGVSLSMAADACDDDEFLDAGEHGVVTLVIVNGGAVASTGASLHVTTATLASPSTSTPWPCRPFRRWRPPSWWCRSPPPPPWRRAPPSSSPRPSSTTARARRRSPGSTVAPSTSTWWPAPSTTSRRRPRRGSSPAAPAPRCGAGSRSRRARTRGARWRSGRPPTARCSRRRSRWSGRCA